MPDPTVGLRRRYIEGAVREAVGEMNRYFQQEGVTKTIREEDLGKMRLSFEEPVTREKLFCRIVDAEKVDPYFIGKNVGRVFTRYFHTSLEGSFTPEAEKIKLVVRHLFGILQITSKDPEADVDGLPEIYESARESFGWYTLRETGREKTERVIGKPVNLPESMPQTEDDQGQKKDYFKQEEQSLPPEDLDDLVDPEEEARRGEEERKKEAKRWDPNQERDFGYGFDISDIGHEEDEKAKLVRRDVDSVKYDGLANDRQANMSEEFQATRTIYHGRREGDNWKVILVNLLTSPEEDSIIYLKGIFNY